MRLSFRGRSEGLFCVRSMHNKAGLVRVCYEAYLPRNRVFAVGTELRSEFYPFKEQKCLPGTIDT